MTKHNIYNIIYAIKINVIQHKSEQGKKVQQYTILISLIDKPDRFIRFFSPKLNGPKKSLTLSKQVNARFITNSQESIH